jgi:hypothetical protein
MIRHLLLFLLLATLAAASKSASASTPSTSSEMPSQSRVNRVQTGNRSHSETPAKSAGSHGQAHPHAKAAVPSWDELAHIHHFHRHRLKKLKKHYRKSLWMSKLLLLVTHAAVLFISYLHVTPH